MASRTPKLSIDRPNERWRGRYSYEGHQWSVGRFDTEDELQRAWTVVLGSILGGTWQPPKSGGHPARARSTTSTSIPTFNAFADQWLELRDEQVRAYGLSPDSVKNDLYGLRKWLRPTFGSLPITDVDYPAVHRWWTMLGNDPFCGPSARRLAYTTLSALMKHAIRSGHITATPCLIEKGFADVSKRPPIGSKADFDRIRDLMPEPLRLPVLVAYGAALRIGEVCGLEAHDVDFPAGVVWIARQFRPHLKENALRKPKGRKLTDRAEKVYLPDDVLDALRRDLAERPRIGATPLFSGPRTDRLRPRYLRDEWNRAVKIAGCSDPVPFHSNRGRALTDAGHLPEVNVYMLRDLARHRSTAATERYVRRDDESAAALAKLRTEAMS